GNFPRIETVEIHLATNFQNIVMDHPAVPADLRRRVYAWLDENATSERKAGDTPEQFYYRARKRGIGPFKQEFWSLPEAARSAIAADLEKMFKFLFAQLKTNGTAPLVTKYVEAPDLRHGDLRTAASRAVDDAEAGE
ncbi:MAG: aldolase, partial [Gemmatimonadota bacterium]